MPPTELTDLRTEPGDLVGAPVRDAATSRACIAAAMSIVSSLAIVSSSALRSVSQVGDRHTGTRADQPHDAAQRTAAGIVEIGGDQGGLAQQALGDQTSLVIVASAADDRRHAFGGKAGAQRFQFRHRLEHAGQPLDRGPRHHRAAMRTGIDQAGGNQLSQRFAHRGARDIEAPRNVGLVQRRARRQRAADDLVGKLQPQFLGAGDLVRKRRTAIDAPDDRPARVGSRRCPEDVEAHVF